MRAVLTLILSLAVAGASCGSSSPTEGDANTLTVVASFYPIAEAARRAGGNAVDVVELTPPGVEPHDIELTPDDIEAIATADVVLYAGGGFQPAVEDAIGEAQGLAVDVTSGISTLPPRPEEEHAEEDHAEEGEEHVELAADPHVWLDPTRYAAMASAIAHALDEADGESSTAFEDALDRFEAELGALDNEYSEGLADCDSRLLVVNHAAFGYLADAYDLEQEAISGLSPEAEPDPQRLAELRDLVISEGVTTIFVESLVSQAVGETLAEEAGVTTAVLNPLEGLTQEQLDAGEDYLSVMRTNLDVLRDGLGCR
jgi:zinc transport system substrate-binding protein